MGSIPGALLLYDKYTRIQKCSSDFYFYRGKTKTRPLSFPLVCMKAAKTAITRFVSQSRSE